MGANQLLNRDCETCAFSSTNPSIKNVILVSIQPERNIQLFPLTGMSYESSYHCFYSPKGHRYDYFPHIIIIIHVYILVSHTCICIRC